MEPHRPEEEIGKEARMNGLANKRNFWLYSVTLRIIMGKNEWKISFISKKWGEDSICINMLSIHYLYNAALCKHDLKEMQVSFKLLHLETYLNREKPFIFSEINSDNCGI